MSTKSKVTQTESGAVQALIEETKDRDMSKYSLKGIDFEAAANGVIANLRFRLKPEEEARLSKKGKGEYLNYETRYCDEKLVFEGFDPGEVSDFLMTAMREFKMSKASTAAEAEDED